MRHKKGVLFGFRENARLNSALPSATENTPYAKLGIMAIFTVSRSRLPKNGSRTLIDLKGVNSNTFRVARLSPAADTGKGMRRGRWRTGAPRQPVEGAH